MQVLKKIVTAVIVLMVGCFLVKQANVQASAVSKQVKSERTLAPKSSSFLADDQLFQVRGPEAESGAGDGEFGSAAIQATRRISIPFGFQTPLAVLDFGRQVVAIGHGGCTDGEQITVAITVTQASSGAAATGEDEHPCTGELHTWSALVTADTAQAFVDGAAEACGFAVSWDGDEATDSYGWCRDVELVRVEQQVYLPMIRRD